MIIGIGVNAWLWTSPFDREAVRYIGTAEKMGFDAFTMPIEEPERIDIAAVRAAVDEHPIRLDLSGAYGPGRDLASTDASESDRGTPGSAQLDWEGVARALKEIGYPGDRVIESFTRGCEAIADAACIWRPLVTSQDALVDDGGASCANCSNSDLCPIHENLEKFCQ